MFVYYDYDDEDDGDDDDNGNANYNNLDGVRFFDFNIIPIVDRKTTLNECNKDAGQSCFSSYTTWYDILFFWSISQ